MKNADASRESRVSLDLTPVMDKALKHTHTHAHAQSLLRCKVSVAFILPLTLPVVSPPF